MTTQLTDEQIDALVNAVTDANPTANCETWSRLIARSTIAADRAQRGPDELESLRAESEERLQNCAALVAEVERLRAEVTRPESTDMTLMRALVQSQATELERLRKDAERYQWLRSEHKRYDPVCHLTWKQPCDENGSFWVNTAHLDSDIDAAMKGTS